MGHRGRTTQGSLNGHTKKASLCRLPKEVGGRRALTSGVQSRWRQSQAGPSHSRLRGFHPGTLAPPHLWQATCVRVGAAGARLLQAHFNYPLQKRQPAA